MDDVKVHYNSSKPAQLNAHAYAQGTDIHVASGQEKHLPHEAWHVVQQKQGRVKPTMQLKAKVNINDDKSLEKEADVMGEVANEKFVPSNNKGSYQLFKETFFSETVQMNGKKRDLALEAKETVKVGKRKLGKNIGLFRPFLGEHEQDLFFIYGLISGFTLNGIISSLKTITSDKTSKANAVLMNGISHEIEKVVKLDENYTAYLDAHISNFKQGRIAELIGLAGELSTCARLIASGKKVDSLGKIYETSEGKQEVDISVKHNGISFFLEVAASISKLRDKISGGAQMDGYKKLVEKNPKSKFAYTSPDLSIENLSFEMVEKLENAGAWLVIGSQFYSPAKLKKLVGTVQPKVRKVKIKKKTSKGTGKAKGRIDKKLNRYKGKSATDVLKSFELNDVDNQMEDEVEEEDHVSDHEE
jgi:hypothetical protein